MTDIISYCVLWLFPFSSLLPRTLWFRLLLGITPVGWNDFFFSSGYETPCSYAITCLKPSLLMLVRICRFFFKTSWSTCLPLLEGHLYFLLEFVWFCLVYTCLA